MIEADRAKLQVYVNMLASHMLLQDWAIEVVAEILDDDLMGAHAQCEIDDSKKRARIWFAEETFDRTPNEIRYTAVHELCHVHLDQMWHIVVTDLRMHLSNQGHWVVTEFYRRQMEIAIDSLARIIAPWLPVIEP